MTGLPRKVANRWYLAGTILSVVAIICGVVSHFNPRVGYPLVFMFTMFGILAVTRPSWELPERRKGVAIMTSGFFLLEMAILYVGITSRSA